MSTTIYVFVEKKEKDQYFLAEKSTLYGATRDVRNELLIVL